MSSNTDSDTGPDSVPYRAPPLPVDRTVRLEPFQKSEALSLGVELELQLVNTHDFDLAPYAEDMLRLMGPLDLQAAWSPK